MKRFGFLVLLSFLLLVCAVRCANVRMSESVISVVPALTPFAPVSASTKSSTGWQSHTNANQVEAITFDTQGNVWTAGGGIVKWNISDNTYTKFLMENGLPNHEIRAFAIAADDSLWIAGNGVSHFDGQVWVTYDTADGLARDEVRVMDIAPNGDVWVGTKGSVSRFDGSAWVTYSTEKDLKGGSSVLSIGITPDNSVLVGTFQDGKSWLSYFDGKTWRAYSSDYVHSIAVAPDGTAWLGTRAGVSRFDVRTRRIISVLKMYGVQDLAVTSDNTLWLDVCTTPLLSEHPEGVWSFNGKEWQVYTSQDDFIDCDISAIAVAPDDEVWFGTGKGLARFDGQTWPTYYTEDNLISNNVSRLIVGSDGSIWALEGKPKVRASRFDNQVWTNYDIDSGWLIDMPRIGPFVPDLNGTAWYGSVSGLLYFDGQVWTQVGPTETVEVISLVSDGSVWVTTQNSVSSFSDQIWTTYTCGDEMPCKFVRSVIAFADGSMLVIVTDSGLLRFDGNRWISYTQLGDLLGDARIRISQAPDGTVWAFSDRGGNFAYFDGQDWITYTLPEYLTNKDIDRRVMAPDGSVWFLICDDQGLNLIRFDGESWVSYQYEEKLSSVWIDSTIITPDGCIWIAIAGRGILSFDGQEWSMLTTKDGLPSNTINSMVLAPDGTFWLSSDSGIAQYSPPTGEP